MAVVRDDEVVRSASRRPEMMCGVREMPGFDQPSHTIGVLCLLRL
jgi:hypothetical protein